MFIEFPSPKIVDNVSTRDRTKVRFGGMDNGPNLWATLSFKSESEAIDFFETAIEKIKKGPNGE